MCLFSSPSVTAQIGPLWFVPDAVAVWRDEKEKNLEAKLHASAVRNREARLKKSLLAGMAVAELKAQGRVLVVGGGSSGGSINGCGHGKQAVAAVLEALAPKRQTFSEYKRQQAMQRARLDLARRASAGNDHGDDRGVKSGGGGGERGIPPGPTPFHGGLGHAHFVRAKHPSPAHRLIQQSLYHGGGGSRGGGSGGERGETAEWIRHEAERRLATEAAERRAAESFEVEYGDMGSPL